MQVSNRYEDMTADMRAEVEEVAAGLGVARKLIKGG